MSKTNTKTKARKDRRATPSRPRARAARLKGPTGRVRRRRAATWAALLAVVAVGAAAAVLLRTGAESSDAKRPYVGGDLHSLALAPTSPERLYVGGHDGVAVSTDGGRTWRAVESLAGADAMAWAFTDESVLVGGHPGLFTSEDGGRTFRQDNEGLPATDIHALGSGPGVIYAASPELGVFASTDGGASWEVRTDQIGHAFMGTIVVDPDDPDHLVAPDMEAGAVESSDGGRSWSILGGAPGAMWVSWDRGDTERIVVSGMGWAASSADAGRTWEQMSVPSGTSIVEIGDTNTLYAGVLDGTEAVVWASRDGGETWTRP